MLQLMRRTLKVGDPTEFHGWLFQKDVSTLIIPLTAQEMSGNAVWTFPVPRQVQVIHSKSWNLEFSAERLSEEQYS